MTILMDEIERVRSLLSRHGLPDATPVVAPVQGVANRTYFAGKAVVRLAVPDEIDDWRTETLVHPYVQAHGIRVPRLLGWGEGYTILRRVAGTNLAATSPSGVFRDVGVQLARLHALPPPSDPEGVLDVHGREPLVPERLPEPLRPLAERLRGDCDGSGSTFVHGDLAPQNLLVTPWGEACLIDWGDGGFGHPAFDFSALPLNGLSTTLDAYREHGGVIDGAFGRRLVGLRLGFAADRAEEGDSAWIEELLAHSELLERLADTAR